MGGEARRRRILEELSEVEIPKSASSFAQEFGVSRQIVVGDVALLRARGIKIIATARGYLLERESPENQVVKKIVCCHSQEQTEDELSTIVSLGGEVIDVAIEHAAYGELIGGLPIKNLLDVTSFMETCKKNQVSLLSELTSGIHMHTVRCSDEEQFKHIEEVLLEKNILYKEQ